MLKSEEARTAMNREQGVLFRYGQYYGVFGVNLAMLVLHFLGDDDCDMLEACKIAGETRAIGVPQVIWLWAIKLEILHRINVFINDMGEGCRKYLSKKIKDIAEAGIIPDLDENSFENSQSEALKLAALAAFKYFGHGKYEPEFRIRLATVLFIVIDEYERKHGPIPTHNIPCM